MNEVIQTIINRRSTRKYLDKKVNEKIIDGIVNAGRYAPSAMNKQDCIILVISNKEIINNLSKINAQVMGKEDIDPFYGAPTLITVLGPSDSPSLFKNGACIIENMMIACEALGLGSCWINRADKVFESEYGKKILKCLNVGDNLKAVGHLVVGYKANAVIPNKIISGNKVYKI